MASTVQLDFFLNKLNDDLENLVADYPVFQTADKAFGPWSVMLLEDLSIDEAVEGFVDGGGDKGIDFIHIPDNPGTLLILQSKRYQNIERNLGRNDILIGLNGVRWLLNGDIDDPTVNPAFRAKASEFRSEFTASFPTVDIYIVTTGQLPSDNGQAEIELFLTEVNSPSEKVFSIHVIDVNELLSRFRKSLQQTTPNEITLELSQPRPFEHDAGNLRAIVGSIRGSTVAELFEQHGNSIFEANVRNFLGSVKINRQIEATASDQDQSIRFWFYNNGISMICSQLSFRSQSDSSTVRLMNAQIVNGCQTVHSLWHAFKSGNLQDDVEILIRIVEQPDAEFVRLATRYNNTQNAVKAADLVGRDPHQIRLQEEMELDGYYYETRRGDFKQYFADRKERIEQYGKDYTSKVITLKEAAQACAAFYLQQPVVAKNKTVALTTPIDDGGLYEEVFGAKISSARIIGAVNLRRRITAKRKLIVDSGKPLSLAKYEDWLPHSDYHLLSLFSRQYFDPIGLDKNEEIKWFFVEIESRFDNQYARLAKKIGKFLASRKKETGYSHPRYFKTEQSWQEIQSIIGRRSPIRFKS